MNICRTQLNKLIYNLQKMDTVFLIQVLENAYNS